MKLPEPEYLATLTDSAREYVAELEAEVERLRRLIERIEQFESYVADQPCRDHQAMELLRLHGSEKEAIELYSTAKGDSMEWVCVFDGGALHKDRIARDIDPASAIIKAGGEV